jgi:murein DD-endopeptidase MepM/ murein hydrolase activator NlpD
MAYPLKDWKTTFKYGAKYKDGGFHKGIDGRAAEGTPVYAAVSGVVVHSGPNKFLKGWGRSFGIHVIVDNDKFSDGSAGLWSGYCHLSKVKVAPGQRVKKGQLLGWSGSTGNSSAPHLHFQILSTRLWNPSKHVNPDKWLKA